MKTKLLLLALLSNFNLLHPALLQASSTIDPFNKYSWGENIGWMDWSGGSGETATGAFLSEYVCSGYIYSANVGWINLGSGSPANGIQYQNNSATDFGVNLDAFGNLRGYAYSADVGWINFETNGAPTINRIELTTTAKVAGLDDAGLQKIAEGTKANCPVSRALKAVDNIVVTATVQK